MPEFLRLSHPLHIPTILFGIATCMLAAKLCYSSIGLRVLKSRAISVRQHHGKGRGLCFYEENEMRGLAVNQFVEVDERLLKNWSRCEAKPFGPATVWP